MKKSRIEFIKQAHEAACIKWRLKIKAEFPKIFEDDFKVGDWVKGNLEEEDPQIGRVMGVTKMYLKVHGNYLNSSSPSKIENWGFSVVKATKEEIESHLIAEANKRGFKVGTFFKNMGSGFKQELTQLDHYYSPKYDGLCSGCTNEKDWEREGYESNAFIYKEGKWAEIINSISKKEAEQKLGLKIID